jgi:type VI secretion system protein ImpL
MNARRISGYWIAVGAMTLTVMLIAYFQGEAIDPSPFHRIVLAALIGTTLLLLRPVFTAAWRIVARYTSDRKSDRYKRDPAARVGVVDEADPEVISQRVAKLKLALKDANGFRWRYRQPWLLLTGEDASIGRLLPELVEQSWLVTDAAVLLRSKTDKDGRPNEAWLRQLIAVVQRCSVVNLHLAPTSVRSNQFCSRCAVASGI